MRRVKMASWVRSLALAAALVTPVAAPAQTTSPGAQSAPVAQPLKSEELDQLVAPIALYPDPLLAEVLMASAYPLEVVQAERWLEAHKNLKGDRLKTEVDKQPWDESIKSLVATPDVLAMMSRELDWTRKLGDAVVAQVERHDCQAGLEPPVLFRRRFFPEVVDLLSCGLSRPLERRDQVVDFLRR